MAISLKDYGLDKYQSMAYLALVQKGICTASALSAESGVPHGKIYPVLAELERKGFVTAFAGAPKRFMAVEPKIVVENAISRKEQELEKFRQESRGIISEIGSFSSRKPSEIRDKVTVIEGYKNYLNLSVALHEKAKKEYLSISRLPVYKPHIQAYKACIKRGVRVRLLASMDSLNKENLAIWRNTKAEIRVIDYMPTRFSIVDSEEVVIRMSEGDKYIALMIQNPSLALSLKNYFDFLWKTAKPLSRL